MAPFRLATRLGITHGVLALLVAVLLVTSLQGLFRIIGRVTLIRDDGLSSIDAEENVHRAAWAIEVAVRHGRLSCASGGDGVLVRQQLSDTRAELERLRGAQPNLPQPLLAATGRYLELANAAIEHETCPYLLLAETDALRARLDEELTNAWIDRLHDVHGDIEREEDAARRIAIQTAAIGVLVALIGATAAAIIARTTARSVTAPIAELAREATRVGEGDFRPIPQPRGPREVEELWRDLDLMRGRLLELDQLKIAFLANVSHELRSPLTRVRAALSLLSDRTCGPLNEQQARVVELGSKACEREVRIVTALLDMSRLDSGLPLKVAAGERIDRVLATVIEDERNDAAERGVKIEIEAEGDVPQLEIDSALVERALANLVRNAVSVSGSGQVVRVSRKVEGKTITVDILDEGPGVPDEVKVAAFRPFATSAIGIVGRPAGIGLGLSLAHEVARAHGGALKLVRSGGDGTLFRFELPIGKPA